MVPPQHACLGGTGETGEMVGMFGCELVGLVVNWLVNISETCVDYVRNFASSIEQRGKR